MKRSRNFKMVLVLLAIVSLMLLLLVGCDKKTTDSFDQFVPPSSGIIDQNQIEDGTTIKTQLSQQAAVAMLFDTIVKSKVEDDSDILEFSMEPNFETVANGVTKKYKLRVYGVIDTKNNDNSVYSFEVITEDDSRLNNEIIVLGIYFRDGEMFIDSRNYETGGMVHQYYVDDMDISLVMKYIDQILNELDVLGFVEKFDIGALMANLNLDPNIKKIIDKFVNTNGTLLELLFSLIADEGCYVIDAGNGVTKMVLPCKIGTIINTAGEMGLWDMLINMITGSLDPSMQGVIGGVVDVLLGGFINGTKTVDTNIYVDIEHNSFKNISMEAVIKENRNASSYKLGLGELSLKHTAGFKEKILERMAGVTSEGRSDYSFTTLSADVAIDLNLNKHTYTLGQIDSVVGNAIAGLLGGVTGNTWTEAQDISIDIAEDTVISLHLKLRAEINLKDNSKSIIAVELLGKNDSKLRLGVYYKGADEALYIDLSGMGGGKTKVGNINLNELIVSALDKYIPEIPSILDLVNGKIAGTGASNEYSQEYLDNMASVKEALASGKVYVPHFLGANAEDSTVAPEENGGSVDVMGLITGIIGCAELKKGGTKLSIESLGIYLTQDVIDTVLSAVGFDLPVTRLDLVISQTQDDPEADHPTSEEGWKIQLNLDMAKDYGQGLEDLLGAEIFLYLNYGNPDKLFEEEFANKDFSAFVPFDLLHQDETGAFDNLVVGAALEARFKFKMTGNSTLDLSPLGQMLMGLCLQLKSTDDVYVDLGVKVKANVNIATILGLTKGEKTVGDLLKTLEARIDITKYANDTDTIGTNAMLLCISNGTLYLEAPGLNLPKYKINILDVIDGNVKLFNKDTSTASAQYTQDTPEKAKPDFVAILVAALKGITIDNSKLEVAMTDVLFSSLFAALGLDFSKVGEIKSDGTYIKIENDGLDLSKLWLEANIGMQQNTTGIDLGLGLGHIAITVGGWDDIKDGIVDADYSDLLNGGNIFLGAQVEIAVFLKQGTVSLDNMLGALLADASQALDTEIDIQNTLDGSIYLSLMFDVDISSSPATNDTKLLIELRKRYNKAGSTGDKLLLGLYYDASCDTLYLDTDGKTIKPVALKNIGLITLLSDLINGAGQSAMATADIDLSAFNPVIVLGNPGVQIELMQGITGLLVGLIAGDFNDYIDFENSHRYYLDNGKLDASITNVAHKDTTGNILYFQKDVEKYVYIDGAFVKVSEYTGDPTTLTKYAYFEGGVYEKISDPTDSQFTGIAPERLEQAVATKDGLTYKEYAFGGGTTYVEITPENAAQYASAAHYAKFLYKDITKLGANDTTAEGYGQMGWVAKYSDAGLPTYVRADATEKDLCLYTIYNGGKYVWNQGTPQEKEVSLNIPELGVKIAIGQIKSGYVHAGQNDVAFNNGIGIGIFFTPKATETNPTPESSGSIAIKIGNIRLNKQNADNPIEIGEEKLGYDAYFEMLKGKVINESNPSGTIPEVNLSNITDLMVYINLELNIEMGAYENKVDPDMTKDWKIGEILGAVLGGTPSTDPQQNALMAFVKNLLLTFDIPADINTKIGLRIAGNLNIGKLLSGGDMTTNIFSMLQNSEVAVELKISDQVVLALYIEQDDKGESWVYVNGNGSLIANTKFKIQLNNILSLVSPATLNVATVDDSQGGATAGEKAPMTVVDILKVIDGALGGVTITNNSVYIGLGAKLLSSVVGLIAGVEGVELPELNETNSFLEINTSAENPYFLKLGVGIDPIYLALSLGGLEIGLSNSENVIPGDKHLYEDVYNKDTNTTGYKTVSDLAENISLQLEVGVDAELFEGEFNIGDLLSAVLQSTGTNIDLPLSLDIQEDLLLNLRIQIGANINLNDINKSQIKLAIKNIAREEAKQVIFAVYFEYDEAQQIPVLYVENNFTTNSGKYKIENFDLLGSLLGKTTKGIVGILGGLTTVEEGTGAIATADGAPTTEANIILALSDHTIKLNICKEVIEGLLSALLPNNITPEIQNLIKSLNISADATITTKPISIAINVLSNYFKLGVMINEPQISLNKIDIFNGINFADFGLGETGKDALGIEFGLKINYDIGNGVYALDSIINDLAGAEFAKDLITGEANTIGQLLGILTVDALCQNTRGYIGLSVKLNVVAEGMRDHLATAGEVLYDLVMGKLDNTYESSGTVFDPLELLKMIEAGIVVDLNGKKVWVSLVQSNNETYVALTLSEVNGQNFKLPIQALVDSIKGATVQSANALATADAKAQAGDNTLVNALLNKLLASVSFAKDTGVDIALNPELLSFLMTTVVADLIGDGFTFGQETYDIFKLTNPYFKNAELGTLKPMDDRYYQKIDITRDVLLANYLPNNELFENAFNQPTVQDNLYYVNANGEKEQLYKNDGIIYYSNDNLVYNPLIMPNGKYYTKAVDITTGVVSYTELSLTDGNFYKEVKYLDQDQKEQVRYDVIVDPLYAGQKFVLVGGEYVLYADADKAKYCYVDGVQNTVVSMVGQEIYIKLENSLNGEGFIKLDKNYIAYYKHTDNNYYGVVLNMGKLYYSTATQADILLGDAFTKVKGTDKYVATDGTDELYTQNADGSYQELLDNTPIYIRYTHARYMSQDLYKLVGQDYVKVTATEANEIVAGAQDVYVKNGDIYEKIDITTLYRKVEHSGISWSKANGLQIKLMFAENNNRHGFSLGLGLDATLKFSGEVIPVLPKGNDINNYDVADLTGNGNIKLSFVLSIDATGKTSNVTLDNLIKEILKATQKPGTEPILTDADFDALSGLGGLILGIHEGTLANVDIRVSLSANLGSLISQLTSGNVDIIAILKQVELAIEILEDDTTNVKGGLYLYKGNLYIDYAEPERGVFAVNLTEVFDTIINKPAVGQASAEPKLRPEAALLQLWIGEYVSFNGVASTGLSVKITTQLVDKLLSTLLGIAPGTVATVFTKLDLEVDVSLGAPEKGVDNIVYYNYGTKEAPEYVDSTNETRNIEDAEGYDSLYPEYVVKYIKNDEGNFVVQPYSIDQDSFKIAIGLRVNELTLGISLGQFAIESTEVSIIPTNVQNTPVPEETALDIGLNLDLGVKFLEQPLTYVEAEKGYQGDKFVNIGTAETPNYVTYNEAEHAGQTVYKLARSFDLGGFLDGLNLIPDMKLEGLLNVEVPQGGVGIKLSLSVALSLNLSNIDHSLLEVAVKGQVLSANNYEPKTLAAIYFMNGDVLLDLSGIGFGKSRITGLTLSTILGTTNGLDAIMGLLGGGNGASASLATADAQGGVGRANIAILLNPEGLVIEIGKQAISWILNLPALGLNALNYAECPSTYAGEKFINVGQGTDVDYVVYDANNAEHKNKTLYKKVDGKYVECNALYAGEKFVNILGTDTPKKELYASAVDADLKYYKVDATYALCESLFDGAKYVALGTNIDTEYEKYDATNVNHRDKTFYAKVNDKFIKCTKAYAENVLNAENVYVFVGATETFDYIPYVEAYAGMETYRTVSTAETISGIGIDAIVEVLTDNGLQINVKASAADLLGIDISINNIQIGKTGILDRVNEESIKVNDYPDAFAISFVNNPVTGKTEPAIDVLLEKVALSLQLDLNAVFSDGMYIDGDIRKSIVGVIANAIPEVNTKGISLNINLELDLAAIINLIDGGLDSNDIYMAVSKALPLIGAQISIVSCDGTEILGVYIKNGDVYVVLDGLGMPNIVVTNDFLLDIVKAAMGASNSTAIASAKSPLPEGQLGIGEIIGKVLKGIQFSNKALEIALTNDYFVNLLDLVLFGGTPYYGTVMPENIAPKFSGVKLNFNNLVDNNDGLGREGLLQVDLDMYGTHLNLDLFMPTVAVNESIIQDPLDSHTFKNASEVNGASVALALQIKIAKNQGAALGNILKGVVGDLGTKLIIEDDITLRLKVEASLEFSYNLETLAFEILNVDARIIINRVETGDLFVLSYVSQDKTLYIDMSYFMRGKQDPDGSKNLGKFKVTGIDLVGLLGGLIAQSSSVDAVATGFEENPWNNAEKDQIFIPATAENTKASQRYTTKDKKAYVLYTIGATENVYVDNGSGGYKVFEAPADNSKPCFALVGEEYVKLYVKDTSKTIVEYVDYVKGNPAHETLEKYTLQQVYNYTSYKLGMSENVYVDNGSGGYKVYETPADDNKPCFALVGEKYIPLCVLVGGQYIDYKKGDASHANKAKYLKQNATEYVENDGGKFVKAYNPTLISNCFVYVGEFYQVGDTPNTYVPYVDAQEKLVKVYYDNKVAYEPYNNYKQYIEKPVLYEKVDGSYKPAGNQDDITGKFVVADIYGLSAVWADCSQKDFLQINITGKAMLGLIAAFMKDVPQEDKDVITDLIDNLFIAIYAQTNPFIFGLNLDLLDPYNNNADALDIFVEIYGFDHGQGNFGSNLAFEYAPVEVTNKQNYRTLVDVNLDKILSAVDVMDVLFESLKFGEGNTNKLYLNAAINVNSIATNTPETISWSKYIAGLFGLNEDEIAVFYDVMFSGDGKGMFSLDIAAAIDTENLLGGLLSGEGLNLAGTEIQITIDMNSPLFADCLRDPNSKIILTIIGKDTNGLTGIYLDFSGYRNGGKHKISIDLQSLLGDALSSAIASSDNDMGLITDAKIWNLINALVGEIRLADGKITIGLTEDFVSGLLSVLGGINLDKNATTLVSADVFLDIRNLGLGVNVWLGDKAKNEFFVGIEIGEINLAPTQSFKANNTFISVTDRQTFTDIREMKLDIDMTAQMFYEGTPGEGVSLNPVINLISGLIGNDLFSNPNFNIILGENIDAVYTINANIHLDLGNFDNMRIALEVYREVNPDQNPQTLGDLSLGVYVDAHDIYVDLSGLGLPKLKVTGVNLGQMLDELIGGLLDSLAGETAKGTGTASAYADQEYHNKWGDHILPDSALIGNKPFVSLLLAENHFALSTNGEFVNALFNVLSPALGAQVQLPDLGIFALTFDSTQDTTGDGLNDLQTEMVFQVTDNFYFGLRMSALSIDGNKAGVSKAQNVFDQKSINSANSDFASVYDVESGEIGIGRVNLGFDITIRQDGKNTTGGNTAGFESYLNELVKKLLGTEIPVNFNLPDGKDVIGYDISLRASLNVQSLVKALDGQSTIIDEWWQDVELYLSMKPMGYNGKYLIRMYKETGTADVYADLTGLSLFKVKIVGLGGLIGGALSSSSLATADNGPAKATEGEQSNLTITLNQNGIKIDIGMGVINGILGLLGSTLTIGNDGYYLDEKSLFVNTGSDQTPVWANYDPTNVEHQGKQLYRGDNVATALYLFDSATNGYVPYVSRTDFTTETSKEYVAKYTKSGSTYTVVQGEMGYTTITFGATTIPIPVLNSKNAISLGLTYGDKLGLSIGLGLDNAGNAIKLAIQNVHVSVGNNGYVNNGATNGKLNTETTNKENVFKNIQGTNANSFSGLVLNDAYGLSLMNILTSVIKGIDPNITIAWNKNVDYLWGTKINNVSNQHKSRHTNIYLRRTTTSSTNSNGTGNKYVGAGKIEAEINMNDISRVIKVWLHNDALYVDLGDLTWVASGIKALHYMEIMKPGDLNLLSILGGLVGGGASTSLATATAEPTAEPQPSLADTLTGIIKGIDINWWYNVSDTTKGYGTKDNSSLRINLNAEGINGMFTSIYYMLYTMYNPSGTTYTEGGKTYYVSKEMFATLPKNVQYDIVYKDVGQTVTDGGRVYACVQARKMVVAYMQTALAKMLGDMTGVGILGDALGLNGIANGVLKDIVAGLLPLPLLDNAKANYIEILFDKSNINFDINNRRGVIKEIGIYLNKEKVTPGTVNKIDVNNANESAEIVITLGNAIELRSVSSVRNYDSGATMAQNGAESSGKKIYVADPFNPVELSTTSLNNNSNLLKKVDASFYGINDYTSKTSSHNMDPGAGNDLLGGTPIVWDTSTAVLIPGKTSTITGYALNYPVQTVEITVGESTAFSRLYGYINAKGKFVSANSIVVDPTLDPLTSVDTVATLPKMIVIMRKDGQLQMLDTEFKKDTVYTPWTIDGMDIQPVGKFAWFVPTKDIINKGGVVSVDFWYQVGSSSRIRAAANVNYKNSKIESIIFDNSDAQYGILMGEHSANEFTTENIDIVGNLGLPTILAKDIVKDATTTAITSTLFDGSIITFVPQDDTTLHVAGTKGTFTRTFNNKTLQSGDYVYVENTKKAGLLDSLLGGGANADNGSYKLLKSGTEDAYIVKDNVKVMLYNGLESQVGVVGWDYSNFKYSLNAPEKGASGTIVAIVNKFERVLNAQTTKFEVLNTAQNINVKVNVHRYQLDALSDGNINKNQYNNMFVESETGKYSYETITADNEFVKYDANNQLYTGVTKFYVYDEATSTYQYVETPDEGAELYVKRIVQGFVLYEEGMTGTRYDTNFFDENEVSVKVRTSGVTAEDVVFEENDFVYYTDNIVVDAIKGETQKIFLVPNMTKSTETKIKINADYNNGAYTQTFKFSFIFTKKIVDKVVVLTPNGTKIADIQTATVYFRDGTTLENVAIKDILCQNVNGIVNTNTDLTTAPIYQVEKVGTIFTTATVGKVLKDGTWDKDFTQAGVLLEIRAY